MRTVGVGVFVKKANKILIGKRGAACKRGPGVLALPGGMLEHNETINNAIIREVKEETGLTIAVEHGRDRFDNPHVLTISDCLEHDTFTKWHEPHICIWALAKYVEGEPVVTEPGKCEWWSWRTLQEIAVMVGREDTDSEQYYWTPLPLWRRILRPYFGYF